ncbi:MAG: putative DNA-binding domain-containing protein [Carboxylicivirga sp.]|jgi:hypothetical protein|nr:putative DNA-binding domain-containing protein [Carboxylicivirga sp.]
MLLRDDTKHIQEQLASFCLTGEFGDIKLSRPEVVSHYRRLISNVFRSILESAYPITEEWLSEEEWEFLLHEFMSKHASQTPAVWKMPQEFAEFVSDGDYAEQLNKLALNDLVWLEWCEIDVHTMADTVEPVSAGTPFNPEDVLAVNPYHQVIQLDYPIHKMNASEAEANKGNYYVLVYRIIESGQVRFIELSPLHVAIIQKLSESPARISDIAPQLCLIFGIEFTSEIRKHMEQFCSDFVDKEILIAS